MLIKLETCLVNGASNTKLQFVQLPTFCKFLRHNIYMVISKTHCISAVAVTKSFGIQQDFVIVSFL